MAILMRTRQAILLRLFYMARSARSRRPQPFVAYGQIGFHPPPQPLGQARSHREQHLPARLPVAKRPPSPLEVHLVAPHLVPPSAAGDGPDPGQLEVATA